MIESDKQKCEYCGEPISEGETNYAFAGSLFTIDAEQKIFCSKDCAMDFITEYSEKHLYGEETHYECND